MGRSAACREALRPLALSMLAELIHHVRAQLVYKQLVTIVHIFSRCPSNTCLCCGSAGLQGAQSTLHVAWTVRA